MSSLALPFDEPESLEARLEARDREGRTFAVDPRVNVALEASAGTGKTRVLVDRYINLLRAGVDPSNILAITFTRKAASEMRERIMTTLRAAAARGEIAPSRWRELRDRTADIGISTIDAFCLSLLREFPLEADLDPGFSMADETEVPRLVDESLDRSLRVCRALARTDEDVALAFAQLGERRLRSGLAALLQRRLVAPQVLGRFLERAAGVDVADATRRASGALLDLLDSGPGRLAGFLESGPPHPTFLLLDRALRDLEAAARGGLPLDPARVQAALSRVREHFLTQDGEPRARYPYPRAAFAADADWRVQRDLLARHGAPVAALLLSYRRDLNVIVSRGIRRLYAVAESEYRRTLDAHAALDFPDLLMRALDLLRQMEEFAQSRYRLEARYHHLLVDEFQDTSRAQWELVALLVRSWGEGMGLSHSGPLPPSIFIVGDRKQSIYGFRDADVSVLRDAARFLEGLRPDGRVRHSISRSFRSVPPLLAFVNDVCHDIVKAPGRRDAFEYEEHDRFPVLPGAADPPALGLVAADSADACAALTAAEIERLITAGATVRDRETGVPRRVRNADIAILFRTRESHREFEAALDARGIPGYVYKGLGFFDADEIKDVLALLWYLADPQSNLRAAALLRSRVVGLSDEGLRMLAPGPAEALRAAGPPPAAARLDARDRQALADAREGTRRWRDLVDRLPPAELLDVVLNESAYAIEMRGPRFVQARENLKKMRALVRRMQNRGYVTLARLAAHLDRLAVGDEANAAIDALDAVHLMTIHAAKGLEFPIVFVVNLARGTGNRRDAVRLGVDPAGDLAAVSVGDFQSAYDEDAAARDTEETKRLLYVALTRARDRLYLGSVLKDGRLQPGRGSLAEVLPPSLLDCFAQDAPLAREWRTSSGVVHRFAACAGDDPLPTHRASHVDREPVEADFAPLHDTAPRRVSAGALALASPPSAALRREAPGYGRIDPVERVAGVIAHRLLQRFGFGAPVDERALGEAAARLLRPDELSGLSASAVAAGIAAYVRLRQDPALRDLAEAPRWHEVPFTMEEGEGIVRGTIDCLIRVAPARLLVVEFKTGRPRDEHDVQLAVYRRAAERLFPDHEVEARIVYAQS